MQNVRTRHLSIGEVFGRYEVRRRDNEAGKVQGMIQKNFKAGFFVLEKGRCSFAHK